MYDQVHSFYFNTAFIMYTRNTYETRSWHNFNRTIRSRNIRLLNGDMVGNSKQI